MSDQKTAEDFACQVVSVFGPTEDDKDFRVHDAVIKALQAYLLQESAVLVEALEGVKNSVEILRKSNPKIRACIDDLGELGLGFARADYALNTFQKKHGEV